MSDPTSQVTPRPITGQLLPTTPQEWAAAFRAQNRTCWMCHNAATAIEAGKAPSKDDQWHLETCVTGWQAVVRATTPIAGATTTAQATPATPVPTPATPQEHALAPAA